MDVIDLFEENRRLAGKYSIVPDIHVDDFIYKHLQRKWKDASKAISSYYEMGLYSSTLLCAKIDEVIRVKKRMRLSWTPDRILDFASGYGCVARHLQNTFPRSSITTCDIHEQAIIFNKERLNIQSLLSSATPEELRVDHYDVIVCLSFFSHMPRSSFGRWLNELLKSLRPGGALIFTTNGYATENIGGLGIEVDAEGFGFKPQSEQGDLNKDSYGATISHPQFVFQCIRNCEGIRLAHLQEAVWWNIQDAYICIRNEQ